MAGNLENLFVNRLPFNDDQQKTAIVFAFYNAILFALLGVCLASIYAIYQILYMFLMPILWALLVGTVLFPLKRKISANLKGWLNKLDEMDRPLLIGLTLLPIQTMMNISNYIYETMLSFTGICIAVAYCILKFFCSYGAFSILLKWLRHFYGAVDTIIECFTDKWIFMLITLYGIGFLTWIYLSELGQINKKIARIISLPIWFFILAYFSDFFGPFRVLIFSLCCSLLALISAGLIDPQNGQHEENEAQGGNLPEKQQPEMEVEAEHPIPKIQKTLSTETESRLDQAISSDAHLRIICSLCALIFLVNHDSLLFFILIPFSLAFLVNIGNNLSLNELAWNVVISTKQKVTEKSNKFVQVIVAGPLRKFITLLFTSDRMFINGLLARVELISTVCVMSAIAVGYLFFLLFVTFQLHGETVHLVKLGGNVLSSNPDWLRYAMNYTEGHLAEHDLDNYIDQAYQKGRSWLASNIRAMADPKDPMRADQLEEQAKVLVDNLYRLWEERGQQIFEDPLAAELALQRGSSTNGEEDSISERSRNQQEWLTKLIKNANWGLWKRELTELVQQNLEMIWTISQSIWHILLMNINLFGTVLVALLGLIFSFGFELLNFLIECVVFLAVVYYLLISSSDQWLPLDWINALSASLQIHQMASQNSGQKVAVAVEEAISGVFVLSAKMAIFYGLYTYFVYSLFALNVVFIPAMLAAIFAAIPIVPAYSVAVFGIIELWLVRGDMAASLVFAGASIAPLFFADPAFYRELKGSHPYVTGLAVVGGVYWLGLQGAIIGPIILCLMIATLNVYAEFINHRNGANNTTQETIDFVRERDSVHS